MSGINNDVLDVVRARGISEVLHFTTDKGLVGVLAQHALLARTQVNQEPLVALVKLMNCISRKDPDWAGHISLSIGRINKSMLGSSRGWHGRDGIWWVVLSFEPDVIADDGVVFSTTNNIYPAANRDSGVAGFEALFAREVSGRYGSLSVRTATTDDSLPTDPQAEVLYPESLDIARLRAIYVAEEEHIEHVHGIFGGLGLDITVPISCKPEIFQ